MDVETGVRFGTPAARWVIAATVLGSGVVFLDGTVVNVALPHIAGDFDVGLTGLQWVLDAYLVALTSFILLGGSLGDIFGRRRMFLYGLAGFSAASLLCGLAPTNEVLILARALQGVAGALLVPGSLALLTASFHPDDRARAVGAWAGLGGVSTALGPFVGGWLVDAISWRPVFLINLPLAAVAGWAAWHHVPESRADVPPRVDILGAALVSSGLAILTYGLIESVPVASVVGAMLLVGFVVAEGRVRYPLLPLGVFRSRQFTGANLTTFTVYGALAAALFLVVVQLQNGLGYSALEAGCALLPVTVITLLLSARMGALSQRIGPRLFMTVGPLLVAAAMLMFGRIEPGRGYVDTVLPATIVFGLGLAVLVAPLTSTVLAAVDISHAGIASGVNNAVSRLAGLLAVAVLPGLAGIGDPVAGQSLGDGYVTAMRISAVLCVAGAIVAFLTVRTARVQRPVVTPIGQPCLDQCLTESAGRRAA